MATISPRCNFIFYGQWFKPHAILIFFLFLDIFYHSILFLLFIPPSWHLSLLYYILASLHLCRESNFHLIRFNHTTKITL